MKVARLASAFESCRTRSLSALLVVAVLAGACRKEDPTPTIICGDQPPPTTHEFLRRHSAPTQLFEFDANRPERIETANGTIIDISENSFLLADGRLATGPIKLHVRELYTPGELLLAEATTSTNGRLLQSAGTFYIKAYLGNQSLRLNPDDTLRITPPLDSAHFRFNGILSSVQQWAGKYVGTDSTNWLPDPVGMTVRFADPSGSSIGSGGGGSASSLAKWVANMRRDTLGWLSTGAFIYPSRTVTVHLEVGTDYLNTRVFLVASGMNGTFEAKRNRRTGRYDLSNVPINTRLTAVVLRVVNGKYFLGTEHASALEGYTFRPQIQELPEAEVVRRIKRL